MTLKTRPILFSILLLALLFGAASGASADEEEWIRGCNEASTAGAHALQSSPTTTYLKPGERACAISATQTNNTLVLNVSQCREVDVFQYLDADGDGTDSTVTGQLEVCSGSADEDEACNSHGLSAFTGNTFLNGLGASYIRVASGGTTDADVVRWEVKCSGSSSK